MPCAKLQDRRARDLKHDERIPHASQRSWPGQTDERRKDDPRNRVRRADELQIGRRQAHALAVRDRAVQEHARRERERDGGELGRDRGVAGEQPRAPEGERAGSYG